MTQGTKNKKVTTAGSLVFQDACNITTSRWETAHQGGVREEGGEYKTTPSDKHESRACSLPQNRAHTGSSHSCLHCTKVPCIFFFSSQFFINETQHFWFTSSPAFSRSLSCLSFSFLRFSEILNLDYYGRKICAMLLLLHRGWAAKDNMVFLYFAEPTIWRLLGFLFLIF